jgi:hypothetical protein
VTGPPILDKKNHAARSVFSPKALLREARRQKGIDAIDEARVCVLDPDGDIVRRLRSAGLPHTRDAADYLMTMVTD